MSSDVRNRSVWGSTLFPPSSSAMKGSSLDLLAAEIETILKLQ
nr:hypothetical protein [Phocaeicola massiliensis]